MDNHTITIESHFNREVKVFENAFSNVYELLANSVTKYPDREALVWNEKRLTYRELYRLTNDMAANLQQQFGFKKGDRLAILSNNRIEFCISIFAVASLGGIVVPLNIRLSPLELKYMLKDSGTKFLIVEDLLLEKAKESIDSDMDIILFVAGNCQKIEENVLYSFDKLLDKRETFKKTDVEGTDPIFIMYTSGTTGRPKGAVGTHLGVTQNVLNFSSTLNTDYKDRTLISVPLFHVTGFLADFLHMMSVGGTAVLMYTYKTEDFLELLEKEKITYLVTVPTIYVFLLNHPNRDKYDLSKWRLALYGGAMMPVQTIAELMEHYPHMSLINTYGATECTGSCTFSKPELAIEKADSVGSFSEFIDWKIVDEEGNELSSNEIGELYIKGPTVIPEYWNNREASEREFDKDGYWKSGDIGYVDEDEYFYLLDRKKNMINRGGENIYSIEIENILFNHPKIFEAAVVGIPDKVFGEEILASIVLKEGQKLSEKDVRDFILSQLADFKVPKYIQFLEELPKNPSGKILKSSLQDLYLKQSSELGGSG